MYTYVYRWTDRPTENAREREREKERERKRERERSARAKARPYESTNAKVDRVRVQEPKPDWNP